MGDPRWLTVRSSEWLTDWWVIEYASHNGQVGIEATGDGLRMTYAGRMGDADVEGSGEEIRALAAAILAGEGYSAGRCACEPAGDGWLLWSPRNSMTPAHVSAQVAIELAHRALAKIPEVPCAP